ncbi:zinc-binding dehydrogenase [Chitinispirillales bacterium ANBcel5]|uniref:MDR/zinc-dependent alcohol dehydrogenase-like family protein n=1 Tax=Cellulosispirillum alkaliphilum TaxID=3039283 RepID=UPI002A4EF537|nr:zinc-binding dehydrogenase [Chitinispirillales bacterium ANBcel5]
MREDLLAKECPETKEKEIVVEMEALRCLYPKKFVPEKICLRQNLKDEVLVKLQGCGVCASNIPIWEGRDWFSYPLDYGAPGHEGWGIVEEIGDNVRDVQVGDRVCFISNKAFAQYEIVNGKNLVTVPRELNDLYFPGEPLGCAMNIFERSNIQPGQNVAIVGNGFLGILLVRLCSLAGARVVALSRRHFALELAEQFGASEVVSMDDHNKVIQHVANLTQSKGCETVIEASGHSWPLNIASEIIANRGRLIIAGYHQDGNRSINLQQWNWKGIDVINAHEREESKYIEGMKKAVQVICEGKIDIAPLITHTFPLRETNEAFEIMNSRPDGFLKAVVIP